MERIEKIKSRLARESEIVRADLSDCQAAIDRDYLKMITYGVAWLKNSMLLKELEIMNVGFTDKTPETAMGYLQTFQAGQARRLVFENSNSFSQAVQEAKVEVVKRIGLLIEEFNNIIQYEKRTIQSDKTISSKQESPDWEAGVVHPACPENESQRSMGTEGGQRPERAAL